MLTGQSLKIADHRVQTGQRVRFEDAERGGPKRVQVPLESPDILLTHAQIVQEVARTLAKPRFDRVELGAVLCLEPERARPQVAGGGERAFEEAVHH
jgi:hypothetical protein